MDFGQLFMQISHLQIHHLIQVNAPDGTATGFYIIDVSESRQKVLQGLCSKENIKTARDSLVTREG